MSKITGKIEVLLDSSGVNEYIALDIEQSSIQRYIDFIETKVDETFIENKKKRDNNKYHITILNAIQFGSIKKNSPEKIDEILAKLQTLQENFEACGIGAVNAPIKQTPEEVEAGSPQMTKEAFFIVVKNEELEQFRETLFPDWNLSALHCTLAFNPTDVHGKNIDKGVESIIYSKKEIYPQRKIV